MRSTRLKTPKSLSSSKALALSLALFSAVAGHGQPSARDRQKPLTLDDYRRFTLSQQADAGRGKALFADEARLACSKCHTVDGVEGKSRKAGPDLFAIGDKYPRPDLIEAILQPSANITVGYTTTIVTTKSGEEYTGILQQLNDAGVELIGADGKGVRIPKAEIQEQKSSSISLMPEGLHAGLTLQEFNDLVEYLITLRQPESALREGQGIPLVIPELATPARVTPFFETRLTSPRIEGVESGLTGFSPIPGQSDAWLVTHQVGFVWLMEKTPLGEKRSVFLDQVADTYSKTGPNGLLGLAFHPKFLENRKYYLKYQTYEHNGIVSTIAERKMAADFRHDSGEPGRRLINIPSPGGDHGGGCVQFGPDGYLYFAMGDSGPHRDPNGNAQNLQLLLGKMSRIDVDHQEEGKAYAVPRDNPFVGQAGARPEIWALGFRNPWRFCFDPANGDLWVADVGQDRVEEIDIVRPGENHGWNIFEGFERFSDAYRQEGAAYVSPVFGYRRKYGNSVTGGFVYRGKKAPSFNGVYIFADYTSKRIFGMTQENRRLKTVRQIGTAPQRIVSFGSDEEGEIYVVGFEGLISKLDLANTTFEAADSKNAAAGFALPGKGLAQHDFLYAGESKQRRAFIIRKGQVVWTYDDPAGKGEISDAVLLSSGNLLLAHQFAVKMVSPEKKVLWNLEAPKGTEIHTAMPIGAEHVLYVQNGDPAMVRVVNFKTGETKKEFKVPVGNPKGVHGQFRHGRISARGTLLLAHMDMKKVCEYDADGKEIRSWPAGNPWGVTPLKNGNILIVDRPVIREVTLEGETVATITPAADAPEYRMNSLQMAWRLPNGNTLVNNWFNEWSGTVDRQAPPIQAVEFTPDKKIVWALRSWEAPDLGPSTTIQILDEPEAPEDVRFGDIK